MANHRVVCVNHTAAPDGSHRHITHLGVGHGSGWTKRVPVATVLQQLRTAGGDRYFTISPSTGQQAQVIEGACEICRHRPYVRTTADGVRDNNLGRLSTCNVG